MMIFFKMNRNVEMFVWSEFWDRLWSGSDLI